MSKNYWMVVQNRENFEISKRMGLTVHGLRHRHRRRAERMNPDDKVLFYISDLRKWGAIATIKSHSYEEDSEVWKPIPRGERFPYRVKLEPDMVLNEDDYLDGLQLGPRLEYVKRWPPEDWYLAFFETLHLIPQRDFRLIEGEMKRILRKGRGRRRGGARNGSRRERSKDRDEQGDRPTATAGSRETRDAGEDAGTEETDAL